MRGGNNYDKEKPFAIKKYGRGGRIRTGDHLNPIQVRYLAALRPEESTMVAQWPDEGKLERAFL